MSEEEEEVDEEEEEEESQNESEEKEPEKKENDEFNEFRKYNSHSAYANMNKQPKHNNYHNPLAYYYQRQLPIPYQPSQYWMERVQYHQKEIDKAKQILLDVSKPQPNKYSYQQSLNYQPNYSQLTKKEQIESQNPQNYNKQFPIYIPQQEFEPRNYNQFYQSQQPYHFNQQHSYLPHYYNPPLQQNYHPFPQQLFYPPPHSNLQKQQFPNNSINNSFYQTQSPYPNYHYSPPYDYQQDLINQQPKENLQQSKSVQTETKQDFTQLPTGVSQFQPKISQPFSQQNINSPTQPLTEAELEYIEFLRYKEFNKKQQQLIDDQDFQDFQEFKKHKQLQLFSQTVNREDEKNSITDQYQKINKQVFSDYKSQLNKTNDFQQFQQLYTKPFQQETNLEIDRAINVLMKSQIGKNKNFLK